MTQINMLKTFLEDLNSFMNKYEYESVVFLNNTFLFDKIRIDEYLDNTVIKNDWLYLLDQAEDLDIFLLFPDNSIYYSDARKNILRTIQYFCSCLIDISLDGFVITESPFEKYIVLLDEDNNKYYLEYYGDKVDIDNLDIYLLRLLKSILKDERSKLTSDSTIEQDNISFYQHQDFNFGA